MAISDSLRIVVLLCPVCDLPMPFEDYDGSGTYYGKCAICDVEYNAQPISVNQGSFEVRPNTNYLLRKGVG